MKVDVVKNGLYNVISSVIRGGIGIITIPLLIRNLGIEEYGLWTLAYALVGTVSLMEGGLSTATTVFVSQDLSKENNNELSQTLTVVMTGTLFLSSLAALALLIGSPSIVVFFPKLQAIRQLELLHALQLGSLVIWCKLVQQLFVGIQQAYQRYDLINLINLIQTIFLNIGMVCVVWIGGRTVEIMQWQALVAIGGFVSHLYLVKIRLQSTGLRPIWNYHKAKSIAYYSALAWITYLGGILFTRLDRIIVGNILGQSVLGIYGAITDITTQINLFSGVAVQPIMTILSDISDENELKASTLKSKTIQLFKVSVLVSLFLGCSLIILAPIVLGVLLPTTKLEHALIPFCVATTIYSIYSFGATGYYIVLGLRKVAYICTIVQSLASIVSLGLIAIGSQQMGLMGAVLGNAFYTSMLVLNLIGMSKLNIPYESWLNWSIVSILLVLITGGVFTTVSIDNTSRIILFFTISATALIYFYSINKNKFYITKS